MTLSDSTLSTSVWNDVRAVLVAASLTVDTTSVSIRASFNDKQLTRPQVVIMPTNISESSYKFNGKYGKRFIDVTVDCYGTTSADVDSMSDSVKEAIKDALVDESLSGMDLVGVQEDYTMGTYNNQKVHLKSVTFAFDRE